MEKEFLNKTVIITGGAKGLGLATAQLFHEQGAEVFILDIDPSGVQTAQQIGENCKFLICDVSDSIQVNNTIDFIFKTSGKINIFINNAAIQTTGTAVETSEETWDKTIAVNLKGQFLCAKYAIPYMLQSEKPVIVNISSVNGIHTEPDVFAYVTSKAAILGMTKSIAVDFAPKLRCVAVCPGSIDTPLLQEEIKKSNNPNETQEKINNYHLLKRVAQPEEVANFILFLASEKASFCTGQYYRVDGGIGVMI